MALGKQIRHYRAALGLTLEQLEARTGVGVGTIAALEGRDSERSKYASRLAAGLGLTLEQLLDESAQYPPDVVLADTGGASRADDGAGGDLRIPRFDTGGAMGAGWNCATSLA
ncbi:helix-turn-helix transcriptional regulator [Achromobacter xylosoxidans]